MGQPCTSTSPALDARYMGRIQILCYWVNGMICLHWRTGLTREVLRCTGCAPFVLITIDQHLDEMCSLPAASARLGQLQYQYTV